MRKIFKNKTTLSLVALIVVLSIAIGVFNATKSETGIFENITGIVLTPMQKVFTNIGSGFSGFFGYFSNKQKLLTQIEELKKENAELNKKISDNEIYKSENVQLRTLLNLQNNNSEFDLQAAEVIARNPSNWYSTLTIDKGAAHGVLLNQPVVSAGMSLVGRVSEVGTTWAKVTLLTASEHSAGALVSRLGEYGICEGDASLASAGNCRLSFVTKNTNIIVGDTVVTSGLGGIYPKGLVIGKVLKIRPDIQGISQYAVISPETDVKGLKAVFVIKNAFE